MTAVRVHRQSQRPAKWIRKYKLHVYTKLWIYYILQNSAVRAIKRSPLGLNDSSVQEDFYI